MSCNACPPDKNWAQTCAAAGPCQCSAGFGNCDGDPDNGCERSLLSDVDKCGACTNTCGSTGTSAPSSCVAGKCEFACLSGRAHCGASDASGCDTTLASDPQNCGYCGHSCLGGECSMGACQIIALAKDGTNLEGLFGIVRIANNLYVTDDGHGLSRVLFRAPVTPASDAGTPAPDYFFMPGMFDAGGNDFADWLALDGAGKLFFSIGGSGIYAVNPNNTGLTTVAETGRNHVALAVDTTYAYWVQYGDAANMHYRLKDGTGSILTATAPDAQGIAEILTDNGYVYHSRGSGLWVQNNASLGLGPPSLVDGGVDGGGNAPRLLTLADGGYLYFTIANKIYRTLTPGSAHPVENVTPDDGTGVKQLPTIPSLMVVDKTEVYFARGADTSDIYRMKRDGSAKAEVIAHLDATIGQINALTQDDTALYFTTAGNLQFTPYVNAGVYKLAK
ncbi:MAG: hypothetical protein NVS3B10_27470 [Polyangiales bacterium]